MKQTLIFTNHPGEELDRLAASYNSPSVFVITDNNVSNLVLPFMANMSQTVASATIINCEPDDENKNLSSVEKIWHELNEKGATRGSLVINFGGGMITDMGGFAAATFKRGLRFINVPTTLLAAVDASVGGKTGINFNGCKNEVGLFAESEAAIISTLFFNTLPLQQILSGYAEMVKHSLLDSKDAFYKLLSYNIVEYGVDNNRLLELLKTSVDVKSRIVELDMNESGLRKTLNLGHTVGHAFESLAMKRNSAIPHGYAVAWGMLVELILSHLILGFPSDDLNRYAAFVKAEYGAFAIDCKDYPALLELMAHDKKNATPESINFTLLEEVGKAKIDCTASADQIKSALDIYRDMLSI